MSSNARSTVLLPEPDSPVRMTNCWILFLFSASRWWRRSAFDPALVRAGNAHIFAVFGHGPPRHVNPRLVKFSGRCARRLSGFAPSFSSIIS